MNNSANENLKTLFSKMEDFISTKTVVGEPVHIGDVIVIPLVDVTFGMGTGTGAAKEGGGIGGGGGAVGAKMSPTAMVVIMNDTVQLVSVKNQESVNKMIDMIPGLLSKLGLDSLFDRFKKNKDENKESDPPVSIVVADDENDSGDI